MSLIPHEINQNNNFIDAWTIQDESVSDNLIKFFETNYLKVDLIKFEYKL